jgi:hypothetical protein
VMLRRRTLALYDRRMAVEEQFRDIKGKRFGGQARLDCFS